MQARHHRLQAVNGISDLEDQPDAFELERRHGRVELSDEGTVMMDVSEKA